MTAGCGNCPCVVFSCVLFQCLSPGLMQRTSPSPVFFISVCQLYVHLSERNASSSLQQGRQLLRGNLELHRQVWSWILEIWVPLKSCHVPLELTLFQQQKKRHLHVCFA